IRADCKTRFRVTYTLCDKTTNVTNKEVKGRKKMAGGYSSSTLVVLIALAICAGLAHGKKTENLTPDPVTFQWCGNEDDFQSVIQIPENISEGQEKFAIRLETGNLSCSRGLNSTELALEVSRPAPEGSSTYQSDFSSNGYFRVGNFYYPPEGFCITSWTNSVVEVRVCGEFNTEGNWSYPDCGATNTCLPKCCAMNMLLTYVAGGYPQCSPKFNKSASLNPVSYTKHFQKDRHQTPVYYYRHDLKGHVYEFAQAMTHIEQEQTYGVQKVCFRL
ncbi:unnamed protein product, partial [Allacma fusca]